MDCSQELDQQLEQEKNARRQAVSLLQLKEQELQAVREDLRVTTENLAKREARLSQIINTANDAFLSTNITGIINEWNNTAETLFGWPRDEMIGRPICNVLRPPEGHHHDSGEGYLMTIFNTFREDNRGEMIGLHRNGHQLAVEVSISVMVDEDAFIFNAFVHDISAKVKLQDQLTQAQKLESIGQLAAGIAHEINTPTQYIGDNIEFLQDIFSSFCLLAQQQQSLLEAAKAQQVTPRLIEEAEAALKKADLDFVLEEVPNAIGAALDGVKRVSSIVNSMKDFAHPGVDSMTPVDINRAIQSTATVCRSEWRYVAEFTTDFDPSLPPVPCLPGEFNQVVLNLIVNAAQAIGSTLPEGGRGEIRAVTRQVDEDVEIRISDNGPGMPEKVRTRVFDPFFTTKGVGKGTGQGLAISRSVIVDKHHGQIVVESEPGTGATFIIRLPLNRTEDVEAMA